MPASTQDVAKAYFDAIASLDPDGMVACWEPGSIDRLVGVAELRAPDDIREWFGSLFTAFPDFSLEVLEMVTDGTKAAVRWRTECTFDGTGTFMGLRPNGARVVLEGFDLLTVADGRITGNQAYLNGADLARQLGALPPEGSLPDKAMLGALNLVTGAKAELSRRFRQ
jgi:predicted ester cyclase